MRIALAPLMTLMASLKKGSTPNNKQTKLPPQADTPSGSIVVVDDSSPALMASLRGGTLYSAARDKNSKLHDLGSTGFLDLRSSTPHRISKFDFLFANITGSSDGGTTFNPIDTKRSLI
ncbi:uncharacterized protein F4817DRAFT_198287 [Daldinia loculata]|uniref:uncharacterized protein n=1 Tax=Daldinia loculata TaxID=103429 RepID=UPI0020C3F37D|nr:uncharacterized protein F4817DRAFT_198287 [Daldinia loculata]KAI1644845.1 hypothetical protein F4817DRAFT_198287 [Daldinia loculata]